LFKWIDARGKVPQYSVDSRCTTIPDGLDYTCSNNDQPKRQAVLSGRKETSGYAAGTQEPLPEKRNIKLMVSKEKSRIYFSRASLLDEKGREKDVSNMRDHAFKKKFSTTIALETTANQAVLQQRPCARTNQKGIQKHIDDALSTGHR
jgi:hypothetical protein